MARKRKAVNFASLAPFQRRLYEIIGDQTQADFARRAGLSAAGLHRILNGGEPTRDTLVALANAGGVSVGWLAAGETPDAGAGAAETLVRKLAFKASAGTGALVLHDEPSMVPMPRALIASLGVRIENLRAIEAVGESMKPTIETGDLVLLNVGDRTPLDGRIYVLTIGDEAFLKRLRREPGRWVMVSDNTGNPPEPIGPGDDLRIVGRVVWGGRRL